MKTTAMRRKLTFGDPFENSGVADLKAVESRPAATPQPLYPTPYTLHHAP